jgi:hypothetical protein
MPNGTSYISIPFELSDTYIRDVFSSINSTYTRVRTYVNNTWKTFNPAYADKYNRDLLNVSTDMGLVVTVDGNSVFHIEGNTPETVHLHLTKGSNLVPYLSMRPLPVHTAFADIPWYRVQRWDCETDKYVDMRGDDMLLPGHTYWVYVSYESEFYVDF